MQPRSRRALVVLVATIIAFGFLQTPLLATSRRGAWQVLEAFVTRTTGLIVGEEASSLSEQLEHLQAENARLHAELADWRALREQLDGPGIDNRRTRDAVVLGHATGPFRTHLTLNQGSEAGVQVGNPVVAQRSILVGYIIHTEPTHAIMATLYDPAASIPAVVATEDSAQGLAHGHAFSAHVLDTVPQDHSLEPGDIVTTTSHEQTPPGLVIGSIAQVTKLENEAYQSARIALALDPSTLRAVSIVLP